MEDNTIDLHRTSNNALCSSLNKSVYRGISSDCTTRSQHTQNEDNKKLLKTYSSKEFICKPYHLKLIPNSAVVQPSPISLLNKFEQDMIKKTQSEVTQREHAFKSLWEKNNFMPIDPKTHFDPAVPYSTSLNWKQWPPPIPQLPDGLKIPIEFFPHIEYDLPMSGIPIEVDLGKDARAISTAPKHVFNNLNGLLNNPKSKYFTVSPPSLLFVKSEIGHKYNTLIKLQNNGDVPRRICVLRPFNKEFDIIWGADLNEQVIVPPGLTVKIWIFFKPITSEPINDLLTVIIHGDGSIIIPIMVASIYPPILEMEEWDCGCSIVGTARICQFEINNLGGTGRFWILTEVDYTKEYTGSPQSPAPPENEQEINKKHDEQDPLGIDIVVAEPLKTSSIEINKLKIDHLYVKPFKIYPACFRLQKDQRITIKAKYHPHESIFHYEKLALLCDNGEVRWIAIKGIGIDQKMTNLIEVKGNWSAPPCNLPTDLNTKLSMDCGNLLPGEFTNPRFNIINDSCIPVYFFWSIRPILSTLEVLAAPFERNLLQHFLEGSTMDNEWKDYYDELTKEDYAMSDNNTPAGDSLKIFPTQGILDAWEENEFEIKMYCPEKLGYHACVISLFIQQVGEDAKLVLTSMINDLTKENMNEMPIYYEDLIKNMPKIEYHPPTHERDGKSKNHHHPHVHVHQHKRKRSSLFLPSPIYHLTRGISEGDENNNNNTYYDFQLTKLKFDNKSQQFQRDDNIFIINNKKKTSDVVTDTPTQSSAMIESYSETLSQQIGQQKDQTSKNSIVSDPKLEKQNKIKTTRVDSFNKCIDGEIHEEETKIVKTKKWLTKFSALQPEVEIEVWLRSVPLECWINPPFLVATGFAGSSLQRNFAIHNQSEHSINVLWEPIVKNIYSISIEPNIFSVSSKHIFVFRITVHFQNYGEVSDYIQGVLTLPFKSISCTIPLKLKVNGPSLEILTPVINFGIVAFGVEKIMTFALKNSGIQNTTWRVKLSTEILQKQIENETKEITMSDFNHQIRINKMARIWPEWGVLEPGESAGGQIFLKAEILGKLILSIEITSDENPNICLFIPIFGEIQSRSLVLKHGRILVRDIFPSILSDCSSVTLMNPTAFLVPFIWQEPIGSQSKICSIEFEPKFGVVLPKQCITCGVKILAQKQTVLDNLFIPCCVEGMKEPLLLQIEGQVSGLLVAFIMPYTKQPQLEQDDIYNSLFNERWSYIFKRNEEIKLTPDKKKTSSIPGEGGDTESSSGSYDFDPGESGMDGRNYWYKYSLNQAMHCIPGEFEDECLGEDKEMMAGAMLAHAFALQSRNIKKSNPNSVTEGQNQIDINHPNNKLTVENEQTHFKKGKDPKKIKNKDLKSDKEKKIEANVKNVEHEEIKHHEEVDVVIEGNNKQPNKSSTHKHNHPIPTEPSKSSKKVNVELKRKIVETNKKVVPDIQILPDLMIPPIIEKEKKKGISSKKLLKTGKLQTVEKNIKKHHKEKHIKHIEIPGENYQYKDWLTSCKMDSRSFYSPLMAGKDSSFMNDIDIQSNPFTPTSTTTQYPFEGKKILYLPVTHIGQIVEENFLIRNHSPVRSAYTIRTIKYNVDSWIDERMSTIQNLIAMKMRSHSPSDVEGRIMSGKFGIAFEITPREGYLEPYGIINVKIRVHANIWGMYQDELICRFEGISEPYTVYLEALVTGCPVTFQLVPSPPIIRFGAQAIGGPDITRQIIMKNRAPCRIALSWHTLEFIPKAKKPIDTEFMKELASNTPIPSVPPNSPCLENISTDGLHDYSKEYLGKFVGNESEQKHPSNFEMILDGDLYKVMPRQITIPAGGQIEVSFVFYPDKALEKAIFDEEDHSLPNANFKGLALARLHLDKEIKQDYGVEMPLIPWIGLDAGIAATWIGIHSCDSKMNIQDDNGILLFSSPATVALPTCPRKLIHIDDHRTNNSYFDKQVQKKIILMSRHLSLENMGEGDVSIELNVELPFSITSERRQVSQQQIDSLIIFRKNNVRIIIDLTLTTKQVDDAIHKVLGLNIQEKEFYSTTTMNNQIKFERIMWPGEEGYYSPSMDNTINNNTTCISIESLLQIIHPSGTLQMVIMEGWLHLPQVISIPRIIDFKTKFINQNKTVAIKLYNMTEDVLSIKITQLYTTHSGLVKMIHYGSNTTIGLNTGFKLIENHEIVLQPSRKIHNNEHHSTTITINFCPMEIGIHRSFWLIQNLNDEELCVIESFGIGQ